MSRLPFIVMEDDNTEMTISYETIFELLRREKNRDEIQKMPEDFSVDLASYVSRKRADLEVKKQESNSYSSGEFRKAQVQLDSMIRVIGELYDKREKKILNMALTKSRTNADIVDVANLTSKEKEAFFAIVDNLNYYRSTILGEMLSESGSLNKPESPKFSDSNVSVPNTPVSKPQEVKKTEEKAAEVSKTAPATPSGKKMVKFVAAVPKFFDREMNVLGPFSEGEMASLPSDIAEILIKKGRVEVIDN